MKPHRIPDVSAPCRELLFGAYSVENSCRLAGYSLIHFLIDAGVDGDVGPETGSTRRAFSLPGSGLHTGQSEMLHLTASRIALANSDLRNGLFSNTWFDPRKPLRWAASAG